MKKTISFLVLLTMIFTLCACEAKPDPDACADPAIDPDRAQYWREVLQGYRDNDDVLQVLLVRYTGGCSAIAQFYVKQTAENNAWSLVFEEEDAYVGKCGIGKTKEGDGKTPSGDFGVRTAYGIRTNPGTVLPYIDVTDTTYACDEDGEYYNTILDTAETGHSCTGEHMMIYSPEYNYGAFLDYNPDNTPGLGNSIFLHCKGAKPFTGGCVALDEADMQLFLQQVTAGVRVVIGEN